jgi:hypothetical protein
VRSSIDTQQRNGYASDLARELFSLKRICCLKSLPINARNSPSEPPQRMPELRRAA